MARFPSSFPVFFLRQNHKNPNFNFRNFTAGGVSGEVIQKKDQIIPDIDKQEALKDVSKYLRNRPRWEQTLVSEFSGIDFSDSKVLHEIINNQNNAMLKVRFFYWVTSQYGCSCDEHLYKLIFNSLVETKAASIALKFLEYTKFDPDSDSLEVFACCLLENRLIGDAVHVFDELIERGNYPSLATWNLALTVAVRVGSTDVVWKLYGDMMNCGVVPDVETVCCLILALCREDKLSEGYDLLRQCLRDGNMPDNVAFAKLLSRLFARKRYFGVSALLHTMIVNDRLPGTDIYQEIIYWLCRQSNVQESYRIFNELKDRGCAPNTIMYTAMIHGLCKLKRLEDASKLLCEMIEKGMKPTEHTYIVLIRKHFEVGEVDSAQEIYKEMLNGSHKETTMSYNTMIKGLCLNGKIEVACDLFERMHQKGYDCALVNNACNYIIRIFCKEGKVVEGMMFLYRLLDQGFQPPLTSYTCLIEKLSETGEVQKAKKLWKDMEDKGLVITTRKRNSFIKRMQKGGNNGDANSKSSPVGEL